MTAVKHDRHDYAEGTRARRWLGVIFRPILRRAVSALLWLCPDTPIIANVRLMEHDAVIYLAPNCRGGQLINVRIERAERKAAVFAADEYDDYGDYDDQIARAVAAVIGR